MDKYKTRKNRIKVVLSTEQKLAILYYQDKTWMICINQIKGFIPLPSAGELRELSWTFTDPKVPPKGLSGRPRASTVHTLSDRDHKSPATSPLYRCESRNEEVRGKDPSKLFLHASSCPNMSVKDKENARAFDQYIDYE